MTIQVTGKNLDVGEALRGYVQERVSQTVEKYIGRTPSGHVRVEKEHGEFRTDCTIHLWQGMIATSFPAFVPLMTKLGAQFR